MISEREKALEREKKQWHLERTQYEDQWQKEQKRFKQRGWKWTGELWQRAARLNEREEEIIKREMELAEHEKEMARYEAALEEEKVKILEQYKRVKKLERQGKRREEWIQQAKYRLQQQANEHFSVIYKTLQLSVKSLSPSQTSTSSRNSPSPTYLSTHQSVSLVESLSFSNSTPSGSPVVPFRTVIQPSNNSSFLVGFGKIKAPRSFNTSVASTMDFSKEHSFYGCTPPHENTNEFGSGYPKRRTQHQTVKDNETSDDSISSSASSNSEAAPTPPVETVNLVSTKCRSPSSNTVFYSGHGTTSVIDSDASLINVSENFSKKINGTHYTDDKATSTKFVWISTDLSLPPEISPYRFDKYNPHVDWGPLFQSQSIFVVSA